MNYLVFLIGFIVLCFVVILAAGFFEAKLKKKQEQGKQETTQEAEGEATPTFVVGRIYQMEDGSFAKYAGDGKFLKVRK